MKNIAISAYLVCKEMKYDLEVNDLFEILSQFSNPSMATNIIEDILDYKWKYYYKFKLSYGLKWILAIDWASRLV